MTEMVSILSNLEINNIAISLLSSTLRNPQTEADINTFTELGKSEEKNCKNNMNEKR